MAVKLKELICVFLQRHFALFKVPGGWRTSAFRRMALAMVRERLLPDPVRYYGARLGCGADADSPLS